MNKMGVQSSLSMDGMTAVGTISNCARVAGVKNWMLAGGAAANFDLATDIDVFVWETPLDRMKAFVRMLQLPWVPNNLMNYGRGTVVGYGYNPDISKPIQVIDFPCARVAMDVLGRFDIVQHAVGYRMEVNADDPEDVGMYRLNLVTWSMVTEADHIIFNWDTVTDSNQDSAKTLQRAAKLAKRYGLCVQIEDYARLLGLIEQQLALDTSCEGRNLSVEDGQLQVARRLDNGRVNILASDLPF